MKLVNKNNYIIKIENLNTYLNNKHIHRNISLKILKSKISVILGESGCGKSSLLKIIMTIIKPKSGKIFINNHNILENKNYYKNNILKNCSFLFQGGALFDFLTVGENVAFYLNYFYNHPKKQITNIIKEKLNLVGLSENIKNQMPHNLSIGERKKVAIARSLTSNPKIILYDEPTTGLDLKSNKEINNLILKLKSKFNITSIIVTHDINSIYKIADEVFMLKEGSIIFQGKTKEIKLSKESYIKKFLNPSI